ncbi:MAG: ABC transporter substrate-binding protein [Pseudomonadota bacterium]
MLLSRRTLVAAISALAILLPGGAVWADDRPDLIVAVPKIARGLEPGIRSGNVDLRTTHSVFDTLIRRDFVAQAETGSAVMVPGLATSWEQISPTEMVLELRDDVTWHDGTPFTSEDVVFSFGPERVFGEGAPVRAVISTLGQLESVEAMGPHAVKLTWAKPDPIMIHRLANKGSPIVQKAAYMAFAKDGVPASEWMKEATDALMWNPVGTGPFKFEEVKAGEFIRLVSNDDYFMGPPAVASVTFVEVPEVSTRIAGLVSGEYDIAINLTPDQLPVLERYDDIQFKSVSRENSHVVTFNTAHPMLQDRRIRQALSLGINRQELVDTIWAGTTTVAQGPQLTSFNEMFDDGIPGFAYDPEKAKALLAEAGYDGDPIVLRYVPFYYTLGNEAVQILQEMWTDIGVTVELEPMEGFKQMRSPEAMVYTWSNTWRFPDPLGQLAVSYGPDSAIQTRYGYWSNDRFNELMNTLETTVDLDTRRAAFAEAADIYLTEVPSTFLYHPADIYAMRAGIEYTPTPQFWEDFRPDNLRLAVGN